MDIQIKKELIAYLLPKVTENKAQLMEQALNYRTRHVTVLMEDIFQKHNASAVIRSVECLGLQDLHVVEDRFKFSVATGVAMGSSKWINVHKYKKVDAAYSALKEKGYRIIATTPAPGAVSLSDLPLDGKMALVFGTENVGLSEYALSHADEFVHIPMYGFTQSFNVSVSVALCLYHITTALRAANKISWQLSEAERIDIMLQWLRSSIRGASEFERLYFLEKNRPQ